MRTNTTTTTTTITVVESGPRLLVSSVYNNMMRNVVTQQPEWAHLGGILRIISETLSLRLYIHKTSTSYYSSSSLDITDIIIIYLCGASWRIITTTMILCYTILTMNRIVHYPNIMESSSIVWHYFRLDKVQLVHQVNDSTYVFLRRIGRESDWRTRCDLKTLSILL